MTTNVHMTGSKQPTNLTPGNGVTSNGNQPPTYKDGIYSSFQATVTGTGAVGATVDIQCSNSTDIANPVWCTTSLGTITLSGTTQASDGFTTASAWRLVRAVVTGISGTGAIVNINMGN